MADEWITTNEAAKLIGVTPQQVRYLLRHGILRGRKFGHVWMVERRSAKEYKESERKPGPKPQT
jgi:excisionase family DNA binding protein